MSKNSRFSDVLHVLLHMAQEAGPVTSEVLAQAMQTNPVVIRRIMAGLREQGYVSSEKGRGGGWTLARELSAITLHDIYVALGSQALFTLNHRLDAPDCLIEQAVKQQLDASLQEAEQLLLSRLGDITLLSLHAGIQAHGGKRHGKIHVEHAHGS